VQRQRLMNSQNPGAASAFPFLLSFMFCSFFCSLTLCMLWISRDPFANFGKALTTYCGELWHVRPLCKGHH